MTDASTLHRDALAWDAHPCLPLHPGADPGVRQVHLACNRASAIGGGCDDEDDIPLGLLGRRNLTTEQIDTYIAMGRLDRAYRCPPAHGSGGGTGGITIVAPEQLPEITAGLLARRCKEADVRRILGLSMLELELARRAWG